MGPVAQQLMTAEEFWLLPDNGMQRALVRGEVVEMVPPGAQHGGVASEMDFRLRSWAKSGPGGWVGVESGFILARDPDVVRRLPVEAGGRLVTPVGRPDRARPRRSIVRKSHTQRHPRLEYIEHMFDLHA